ncbi:RecX family transcriptional regulator [Lagierella sp.]|uniref:regulatory protein RecX n=1 Tax=Lagierella sp. TaxID=2849657 RepID=UPI00263514D8|nr:RecX family transcriptional regulator [Lagierella sp.]
MEIKNIEFEDSKNLFKITFSDDFLYANYELYNDLLLSKGKILNSDEFKALKDFNDFNLNYSKAINFISYRIRTRKEIVDKLKKEGVDFIQINKILDKLEENGYIDDESFAKSYYESKSRINAWSNKKIEYELKNKGISQDILNPLLLDHEDNDYKNARLLALKKMPIWRKKYEGFKLKNKLYTFLASKGFKYDVIDKLMGELL